MLNLFNFPKQSRLLSSAEFQRVFGSRLTVSTKELLLIAKPNEAILARLGLAIKRKDIKKAVHRNKIKRIIRESFRFNKEKLSSLDIIVLSRSALIQLSPGELRELIDKQWLRLLDRYQKSLTNA